MYTTFGHTQLQMSNKLCFAGWALSVLIGSALLIEIYNTVSVDIACRAAASATTQECALTF